jgi:pyruvate dehydrogenase E1 component alpha subunit
MATHSTLTREERPAEELEELRGRDPIPLYERRLRAEGILDDELAARLHADVDAEITAAERFVEAAPWPDPEAALLDV